jgi:hypothetical protein
MSRGKAVEAGTGANPQDVEGVILNRQKAHVKAGYQFRRENSKSVAIMRIMRESIRQTGTITCTGRPGKVCEVFISKDDAECNGGCYFVGVRGVTRAQ